MHRKAKLRKGERRCISLQFALGKIRKAKCSLPVGGRGGERALSLLRLCTIQALASHLHQCESPHQAAQSQAAMCCLLMASTDTLGNGDLAVRGLRVEQQGAHGCTLPAAVLEHAAWRAWPGTAAAADQSNDVAAPPTRPASKPLACTLA